MPSLAQLEKTLASSDDDEERLDALIALATALLHADTRSAAEVIAEAAALERYRQARVLAERIHENHSLATIHNGIGILYVRLGDYGSALEHLSQSLNLSGSVGDDRGAATALNNIGDVHAKMHDTESALRCFDRSLRLRERLGDDHEIVAALNNIEHITPRPAISAHQFTYRFAPALISLGWLSQDGLTGKIMRREFLTWEPTHTIDGVNLWGVARAA